MDSILVALKQLEQVFCLKLRREVIDLYDMGKLVLSEVDVIVFVAIRVVVIKSGLLD